MYLGLLLVVIVVVMVVGGAFAGGVFTIVLIPLAAIVVASAFAWIIAVRTGAIQGSGSRRARPIPVDPRDPEVRRVDPNQSDSDVPATPEDFLEARRRAQ